MSYLLTKIFYYLSSHQIYRTIMGIETTHCKLYKVSCTDDMNEQMVVLTSHLILFCGGLVVPRFN